MGFYDDIRVLKEVDTVEEANKLLDSNEWLLVKPISIETSTPLDKGILQNTTIVYLMTKKPEVKTKPKPENKDEKKTSEPDKTERPKNPPSQEAVLSVLAAEYDPEKVSFEENDKVVKVPFSTDKVKWKAAHEKMYVLGFKYHKGPPRWVYEG